LTLPLSPYVVDADRVFVSGQVGIEADGSIPDDLGRQVELALDALERQLLAAGTTLAGVLKTTVVLVRGEDFAAMNELYAARFAEPPPARTTIVAGLVMPGLLFEIDAIARRP
jgi:enamine deaminase RidA (YjgF/YER057c/UK114 family)